MPKAYTRSDFLIKDLAVSVGSGGRGGTWMPGPDDPTPPSPISPVASVLANLAHIEAVRGAIVDAVKAQRFDEVARAFVAGEAGGNPVIRTAIQEIGAAVVASAAYAALGSGGTGLPDPDCGGTSLETIPPTLTPVVHVRARRPQSDRVCHGSSSQLAQTLAYVEKAAAAQAPRGAEVGTVQAQLEAALKSLG